MKLAYELLNSKENFIGNKEIIEVNDEDQMENSTDTLEATFVNPSLEKQCDKCEFVAKNKRGLKIHQRAKHTIENPLNIEEVTLNIFGLATEPNLSRNTEKYKENLENEKEAVESVDKIWMSYTREQYKEGYVGKYLPMEIVLKTSVASLWNCDMDFRKDIHENMNESLDIGRIVENIPEKE